MHNYTEPSPDQIDVVVHKLVTLGFDEKRIRKIVEQTLLVCDDDEIMSPSPLLAQCFIEPDNVLHLFETNSLEFLRDRQIGLDSLFDFESFLYSLIELEEFIDEFLKEQKQSRAVLIASGITNPEQRNLINPKKLGHPMNWVWQILCNMYYTEPNEHPYARFAPILSDDDCEFIWSHRSRFYNLRTTILERLSTALNGRTAHNLYDDCTRMISDAFPIDDVYRLIQLDLSYPSSHDPFGFPLHLGCGGLSDLLYIMGHVEEELTIGAYRGYLGVRDDLYNKIAGQLRFPNPGIYYDLVGRSMANEAEQAYQTTIDLCDQYDKYWIGFNDRLKVSLCSDFDSEILIRTRVKSKDVAAYKLHLENYVKLTSPQLEITGELPSMPRLAHFEAPDKNIIRCDGDYWTIRYDGMTANVKDGKGIRYIRYLIQDQGKPILATRLRAMVTGAMPEGNNNYGGMGAEERAEYGLSERNGYEQDLVYDNDDLADLKERKRIAQAELCKAERRHDEYAILSAQKELTELTNYLSKETGLDGKSRPHSNSPIEKARKSVSKAVLKVISDLETEHPLISQHLKCSISRSYSLEYAPQPSVKWEC